MKITWTQIPVRSRDSTSIKLHPQSLKQNHGTVLNIEHTGMDWTASSFADIWSETQVSEVLQILCSALQTSAGITKTRTLKSELFQFTLLTVLLCKITHKKENRFLSIMPFFPHFHFFFCFLQQFDAADEEKQEQSIWRTGGTTCQATEICQVLKQKLCAVSLIS